MHNITSPRSIGSKAESLNLLRKAGFRVPEFLLVQPMVQGGNAASFRQSPPESADWSLSESDQRALEGFLKEGRYYAVRSSSELEDQAESAMAGLFETFLRVPAGEVTERIGDCLASARAERVRAFAAARGLPLAGAMTVIVQEMVEPELSGVLFTVNPQGLLNELTVVTGYGVGSGIVTDQVPVTTLIYHRQDKAELILRQPGSPELSAPQRRTLIEAGLALSQAFPWPVDAEFALAQGQLWLLQARPITALSEDVTVLDNSNLSESYPGLTLPLSIDFARTAYAGIFRGLMSRMFGQSLPPALETLAGEMVTASSGRMYYQINHWYQLMKLLPLSSWYIPLWQDMMGVNQRGIPKAEIALSPLQRACGLIRLARALASVPREMDRLDRDFQAFRRKLEQSPVTELSREELRQRYDRMKAELLSRWDVTLLNDLHAFVLTGLLRRFRGRDASAFAGEITRLGEVASLRPVQLLGHMARIAPTQLLELTDATQIQQYLAQSGPFPDLLRDYLAEYGDRYLEELKLESRTFRTNPELLAETLRALKTQGNLTDDRDDQPPVMPRGLGGWIYRRAARAIRNREVSRLNRTRIFGMARGIFLRLGELLVQAGELDDARDVFWLTQQEAMTGGSDLKQAVRERRQRYDQFGRLPMLSRLEFAGPAFDRILPDAVQAPDSQSGPIMGVGVSAGMARGRIRRVEDSSRVMPEPDEILVTRQTDPGWVFLLTRSAGIISEKGSLLSHTAIIARELSKPMVVGIPGALRRFRDGERVQINGQTGEIRRLEEHERN